MMNKYESIKYIRTFSDIHLDFDVKKKFSFDSLWMPEELPTDNETLLVLAGDIWHAKKPFEYYGESWMKKIASKFKYVICVLGNHDLWGGNIPYTYSSFKSFIKDQNIDNLFLMQNDTLYFGDLKVVGGTLWTDFNAYDNYCMMSAKSIMVDYKYIRCGNLFKKISPRNIADEHIKTKDYIFTHAVKEYDNQKLLVITHHAPSFKSVHDNSTEEIDDEMVYHDEGESYYYASRLDDLIEVSAIDLWIHGHTHDVVDYNINNTRVISNPRGYENNGEITNYSNNRVYYIKELKWIL